MHAGRLMGRGPGAAAASTAVFRCCHGRRRSYTLLLLLLGCRLAPHLPISDCPLSLECFNTILVVVSAELPEHWVALKAATAADLARNGKRIASQRGGRGKQAVGKAAHTFLVSDAVSLVPPSMGKTGGATIDAKTITCCVVGIVRPYGTTKYTLRCNAGVLKGSFFPFQLAPANAQTAAKLNFEGVATAGVPKVDVGGTKAAQRVGHKPDVLPCTCRVKGTRRCPCQGSCSRECGCQSFCNGKQ